MYLYVHEAMDLSGWTYPYACDGHGHTVAVLADADRYSCDAVTFLMGRNAGILTSWR